MHMNHITFKGCQGFFCLYPNIRVANQRLNKKLRIFYTDILTSLRLIAKHIQSVQLDCPIIAKPTNVLMEMTSYRCIKAVLECWLAY